MIFHPVVMPLHAAVMAIFTAYPRNDAMTAIPGQLRNGGNCGLHQDISIVGYMPALHHLISLINIFLLIQESSNATGERLTRTPRVQVQPWQAAGVAPNEPKT